MPYIQLSAEETRLQETTLRQLEFYSLLDFVAKYAISDMGKEAILALKPTSDLNALREEHDTIDELIKVQLGEDPIPFDGFDDVRPKLQKSLVQNAILSAREILQIMTIMHVSRSLKSYFRFRAEKYPLLGDKMSYLHENRTLEKHINDIIDDAAEIKDTASRELARIRHAIVEKTTRLRLRLDKLLAKATKEEMAAEDYVSLRDGRFVLPIKAEHKRHIPGIIHNVSQTGSTVFLEPSETFEMNNEISLLKSEETREVLRILKNLTQEIGAEARQYLQNCEILTEFDSVYARAKYALAFGGVKPVLSEENEVELREVRHPILCHAKGVKHVIPLSTYFSDEKRGQLISGPNAGGKTVALKSVGINIAMALCGIFPLGECRTNFRVIFSSIGDHQSIENDLSTFSSQILQLKHIVDACSQNSLILIDEICSGTDPQEGAALASGILDTFIELKAFFIVTTHQSSLKTYSLNHAEIENASLEFDEEKLVPTYKYLLGIPGNSYAFALSKNLGLSKLVLKRARKYLGNSHSKLEQSIAQLQKYKFEAEQYRREMLQEKNKLETARKNLDNRLAEIKLRKKEMIDKAHLDAMEVLNGANALIENTIKEIQEAKKPVVEVKNEFQAAKNKLRNKVRRVEGRLNRAKGVPEVIEVGDSVIMSESEDSGNVGSVLAMAEDGKTALVDFNGLKFNISVKKLRRSEKKPTSAAQSSKQISTGSSYITFDAKTRLDLRGERAADSIRKIDELISDAVCANIGELTIVHGKGTGALRRAIQEYLADHPSVKSFRNGALVEGGDGVTIIEL